MAQLRQDFQQFVDRDAKVIVLGPDSSEAFSKYWQDNDLPFTGLPDPRASVLKLYGQEINLFKLGRMPAQLIVNKEGKVRFVHYGHSMADIPQNTELFSLLDEINKKP